MNESENSVPSLDDEIAKMSDEELEALILNNTDTSSDDVKANSDTKEPLNGDNNTILDDTSNKELDDLSDEELEALMNENGLFDDEDNN